MIHILTNALDYGDAVSTHCIVLKRICEELGEPATLYARHSSASVQEHATPLSRFPEHPGAGDIVIHQFYNESALADLVRGFPGKRVMMYHNITPPAFFAPGSPVYRSCAQGLRQARAMSAHYDIAYGMSEFSRGDLCELGYTKTGVMPLLMELDTLVRTRPDPVLLAQPKPAETVLIHVGRLAPNKKCDDLVRLLAEYKGLDSDACLILIGEDQQHPAYRDSLVRLANCLNLVVGRDILITGKISLNRMLAYLRMADAFVSLSAHEGFCAPLLESMALGLPTFALAETASEETMGGAGVVFPSLDLPGIARRIHGVLREPAALQTILRGQASRVSEFSPECQKERVKAFLTEVRALKHRPAYQPRVSVVINTYNRSWWLDRCITALRRQTYSNFEIVVVNGPSTDDTQRVLDRHKGSIRAVSTDSRVLCVSRNLGVAEASGELVAFIDDDAIAAPNWLEKLVPVFENPRAGAAGGRVYRMRGRDIEFANGILDREGSVRWNEPDPGLHFDWSEGWLNTVSGNNCIFRRVSLAKIGGFDERIEYYHDEADVVMRLAEAGLHTEHVPAAVVFHEAAKSQNRANPYILNWFAIVKNTLYCALKNYQGPESRQALAYRIARGLVRDRMGLLWRQWREGKFSSGDLVRMERQCFQGIVTGIRLGLKAQPLLPGIPEAVDERFVPFPLQASGGLAVALLSQNLSPASPGGIATYVQNLARGLRDLGCRVHLFSSDGPDRDRQVDGIWMHKVAPQPLTREMLAKWQGAALQKNLEYSQGVLRKVQDVHARWKLDIVESPNWDAEGVLTALERRLPVVVRAHSPLFKVAETQGWPVTQDLLSCMDLEVILYHHAAVLTGSTAAILELVGENYAVEPSRRVLIPLGIDCPDAEPEPATAVPDPHILFVGRLEKRKGIQTLLAAIPEVLRQYPKAHFTLAGKDSGPGDGRSWEQVFRSNGSGLPHNDPRVSFRGEVDDDYLNALYSGCDIFVAPSLYESFGLVYLEAFAHGKPVVGCQVGGVPEVVSNGETGLLVPPGDSVALKDALCLLIGDPALRATLGSNARRSYEKTFTVGAMAEKTLRTYRAVVDGWTQSRRNAWRFEAQDLMRSPETRIVWPPEYGAPFARYDAGSPATMIYGPYLRLPEGRYRVEFTFWIGAAPEPSAHLATIDVFCLGSGVLTELKLWAEDFTAGSGAVFDLNFTSDARTEAGYEFRVHSTGAVPLLVRDISVSATPHSFSMDATPSVPASASKEGVRIS